MWCLLVLLLHTASAANILGFFGTPSYSHQITYQPIWKELSLRGHQVTVITPNPLKDESLTNLTEIDVHDVSYEVWKRSNISTFGVNEEVDSTNFTVFVDTLMELIDVQLSQTEVNKIYRNSDNRNFDLIIIEPILPLHYGLKDVYNCPLVTILSMPLHYGGHEYMGNPNHPVLTPEYNLPFSRNLSFWQRLQSVLYPILFKIGVRSLRELLQEKANYYYGKKMRPLSEYPYEISMAFANVNPILNVARPNVPAVIEFNGLHIQPPKPLPKDLQMILDNAANGAIYVSFGSNIKSSMMSNSKLKTLAETFAELPYTILWKFEEEAVLDLHENVQIRKWFPQQDVLRHPNVKLFITQGGIQSLDEAIFTKTPVIVVPFFGDQHGNAQKIEDIGMGKSLKFSKLTKDGLKSAVVEVMSEKYRETVKVYHDIIVDQPTSALEKVVWWIEYVIRHKGAAHLQSPAKLIPLYQYYLLDVVGFIVFVTFLLIYFIKKAFRYVVRTCKKSQKHKKK